MSRSGAPRSVAYCHAWRLENGMNWKTWMRSTLGVVLLALNLPRAPSPAEPVEELRCTEGAYSPSFLHRNPMPSRDDLKYQDPVTGEQDFKKDIAQWTHIRDSVSKDDKFSTLPHFMGDGGATKDQVKELVMAMERQRRATSAYRHRCTIEGNSEMYMSDPTATIEKIMEGVNAPLDAPQASGSSDDGSEYMPLYSSCIMANAVHVSILHSTQAVAQWMSGGSIDDQHVGACAPRAESRPLRGARASGP